MSPAPITVEAGARVGRLVLVATRHPGERYLCRCDCGNEHSVPPYGWGRAQSCGCLKSIRNIERTRHGQCKTPEYLVWADMKARCTRPTHTSWDRYGGRGITICDRWLDFVNFIADMGPRPTGPERYTIERVDNDGSYSPENCIWATYTVQARNRRYAGPKVPITHCKSGHEFTEENTRYTPTGKRRCRTCLARWAREGRARRRAQRLAVAA